MLQSSKSSEISSISSSLLSSSRAFFNHSSTINWTQWVIFFYFCVILNSKKSFTYLLKIKWKKKSLIYESWNLLGYFFIFLPACNGVLLKNQNTKQRNAKISVHFYQKTKQNFEIKEIELDFYVSFFFPFLIFKKKRQIMWHFSSFL